MDKNATESSFFQISKSELTELLKARDLLGKLVGEVRYIASISNGQVNRVARAVLAGVNDEGQESVGHLAEDGYFVASKEWIARHGEVPSNKPMFIKTNLAFSEDVYEKWRNAFVNSF